MENLNEWNLMSKLKPPEVVAQGCSVKMMSLRSATLFKKKLGHSCFPVNFEKFVRTPFLREHLWWPLLNPQTICVQFLTFKRKTFS